MTCGQESKHISRIVLTSLGGVNEVRAVTACVECLRSVGRAVIATIIFLNSLTFLVVFSAFFNFPNIENGESFSPCEDGRGLSTDIFEVLEGELLLADNDVSLGELAGHVQVGPHCTHATLQLAPLLSRSLSLSFYSSLSLSFCDVLGRSVS